MPTRTLPLSLVRDIHDDDAWKSTSYIGVAPGSDHLGEEWWGTFEHEGASYRVKFVQGNSYWRSQMGSWDEPFPSANFKADTIECEVLHGEWKFIENPPDQTSSEDDWYALHDGGYIKPEEVLADPEQIAKVREAEETLASFFRALREAGISREM